MKTKLSFLALAAMLVLGLPIASSSGAVAISVGFAPPPIPVYEQPLCPAPGYIWVPGYWAYGPVGYYWVPGEWVFPPRVGFLWTPGYWGYRGGNYVFTNGYWGPTVGFYGGINYGYGYFGHGYYGGRWSGNTFVYNTAVTRVGRSITHTYVNRQPLQNSNSGRASFNGPGGVQAKPTAQEQAAARAPHVKPTAAQRSLAESARKDPALQASNNHGKPKADAVRSLRDRTAKGAAARTPEAQTASRKEANNLKERGQASARNSTAERPEHSQREVKQERGRQAAARHARSAEPKRNATADRRPQPAAPRSREAFSAPHRGQPARATVPQRGKKKPQKKKPDQG